MSYIMLMTTAQVAELLCLKPQTLRVWRIRGKGPRYFRYGDIHGRVYYEKEEILVWLREHSFSNTSEEKARNQKGRKSI